ncbi:hypothetical protein BY996DRAFT_6555218 [Phakopsora pachyrhizi]|nr:hypothetical protein BY996DRAFT_6555218 [Phakopsora pachyrhizi]
MVSIPVKEAKAFNFSKYYYFPSNHQNNYPYHLRQRTTITSRESQDQVVMKDKMRNLIEKSIDDRNHEPHLNHHPTRWFWSSKSGLHSKILNNLKKSEIINLFITILNPHRHQRASTPGAEPVTDHHHPILSELTIGLDNLSFYTLYQSKPLNQNLEILRRNSSSPSSSSSSKPSIAISTLDRATVLIQHDALPLNQLSKIVFDLRRSTTGSDDERPLRIDHHYLAEIESILNSISANRDQRKIFRLFDHHIQASIMENLLLVSGDSLKSSNCSTETASPVL